jgi:malonyl-CoA O-methyltransferase
VSARRHGRSAASRFSSAAASYEAGADVLRRVARDVAASLDAVPPPSRVLEIGCGTGLLTELVAARFPGVPIVAVDAAPGMIERARAKRGLGACVQWRVADALALDLPPFPLVVSSSSLHWLAPIASGFRKLSELVEEGGDLVFALMLEGTLGELHASRGRVAPGKPVARRLPAAGDVGRALAAAGFSVVRRERETIPTSYPSARAFLDRMHRLGVTGGDFSSGASRLSRGELDALVADYEARYRRGDGVYASFVVLHVHARRAAR